MILGALFLGVSYKSSRACSKLLLRLISRGELLDLQSNEECDVLSVSVEGVIQFELMDDGRDLVGLS